MIHGDMNSDNLVLDGAKIVEVTGWSDVQVGDPAQDFAWLFSCSDQGFTDSVLDAYQRQMRPEPDEHLIQRAHFYAEFAIAQWLAHGAEIGDDDYCAACRRHAFGCAGWSARDRRVTRARRGRRYSTGY